MHCALGGHPVPTAPSSLSFLPPADRELQGRDFKLAALLDSDIDGHQTPFAECIRHQHLNEPALFMGELRKQITHALLHEHGDIADNTVPAEHMELLLRTVDPGRPEDEARVLYVRARVVRAW